MSAPYLLPDTTTGELQWVKHPEWAGVTEIQTDEAVCIPSRREMRVLDEITIAGDLHIDGTLVIDGKSFRAKQQELNPYVEKTSDYTLTTSDNFIYVDATAGNITITLPAVATCEGQPFTIMRTDGSANTVTVDADGSETINDSLTQVLAQYDAMKIHATDTEWWIV